MKAQISKAKALKLVNDKIIRFEKIKKNTSYENRYKSDYQEVYHGTETLITELYGENEAKNFRRNVSHGVRAFIIGGDINYEREVQDYKNHIDKCISQLKVYRERLVEFWADDEKEMEKSKEKEKRDKVKDVSKKEAANNRHIPAKNKRLLQQEANSRCPFCGETDVVTFEYHHIEPKSDGGNEDFNNLILTCSNCHSKITSKEITLFEVVAKKLELKNHHEKIKNSRKPNESKNIIEFKESVNQGTVGNIVNIKTNKVSDLKVLAPPDTIGADVDKLNYTKHLIKRYNDYRSKQPGTNKMNYVIIYKKIGNDFGCAKIELLKDTQFEKFVNYMYNLIDNTYLGRINRSKRIKNYSTFEEFIKKHT